MKSALPRLLVPFRSLWALGLRAFLLGLLLMSLLTAARAMPDSRVWIDPTEGGMRLTLHLPLGELEAAFGQPLAAAPDQVLPRHREALSRYLLDHVSVSSSGVFWQAATPRLAVIGDDAAARLEAVIELSTPAGADAGSPKLLYDVIDHAVAAHHAQVFLRGGEAGAPFVVLGEFNERRASLAVPLAEPNALAGALRLFKDGAREVAGDADHLLFLLLLLVVVPLTATAAAGRWGAARTPRAALRRTALLVLAFALGRSAALGLGGTGIVEPSMPIVAIVAALSIAVAALHALRPLFVGGELEFALVFGLAHGFAVSGDLSGAGLSLGPHAMALAAYTLGIEAMQLLLVVAVVPPLIALARAVPRAYAPLRRAVARVGIAFALLWLVERTGLPALGTADWLAEVPSPLPYLIAAEWLFAAALLAVHGLRVMRGGLVREG